ncbi:MAG TPA: DUF1444 family protein [Stellaceae bacterium]|nr:DUF1444 family protein [Stellaceae bacterium]
MAKHEQSILSKRLLLLAVLALSLITFTEVLRAREAAVPYTEDGFTAYLADAFSRQLPDAKVTIKAPLQLEITLSQANGPEEIYLHNVAGACARDKQNCKEVIATFVANMSSSMRERDAPVRKSMLRAVVRTSDYVAQARRVGSIRPEAEPIVRPLAGELWFVFVVDLSHGVEVLNMGIVKKLGISVDEAMSVAKQNLATTLPPLQSAIGPMRREGFGVLGGDYYNASRLMLHDDWAPLAKKMKGALVVAVPTNDVVLYGDAGRKKTLATMTDYAHYVVSTAQRPISQALLRWTPTGWEPFAE